jgi:hypothetical protein
MAVATPQTDARYVVLHHTGFGEPHFDLLLDLDGTSPLLSWRIKRWPIGDGDAIELRPPHRRLYLEYEGAVSRGRGRVERVASGELRITERRADAWQCNCPGQANAPAAANGIMINWAHKKAVRTSRLPHRPGKEGWLNRTISIRRKDAVGSMNLSSSPIFLARCPLTRLLTSGDGPNMGK